MSDYREGIKRDVAEIKFLIHDLRVERFINEVIHFHVTLNTDLEIYSIDQAQVLHGEDLQVLKARAVTLRRAYQSYFGAVSNFSPDGTILLTGRRYIDTIYSICELILNPLWGRIDKVMNFLPADSRSVRSRFPYRNCINWIGGVRRRIRHFLDEQVSGEVVEDFDVADELDDFTRNVIQGYVTEKSSARVELQLGRLDPAVVRGNLPRFRRMYFNLIMNAVDALSDRRVGILHISDALEDDRIVLRVRDDGAGMTEEKKQQLLTDRETLDGELHSLGFVFVRQTVAEFGGELSIHSEVDKGTTITIRLPYRPGQAATRQSPSSHEEYGLLPQIERDASEPEDSAFTPRAPGENRDEKNDKNASCGRMIVDDYQMSQAPHPGSIFAISVTADEQVDYFTHKPYERYWNMTHEDLSPMLFQSTLRGRLEEDEQQSPVLILKPPQSMGDYFDFKEIPEPERSPALHVQMVHDEYIRVARKLIGTGLSPGTGLHLTDVRRYFPGEDELLKDDPFPLERLATQELGPREDG